RGGAASSAVPGRGRGPRRRRGRAPDRSSSCRRRSRGRAARSCGHLAGLELRQVGSALFQELLDEFLHLRDLADQRMREQGLVNEVPVTGYRGLGGEALVGGDVLDEAEQLGREWLLRQRLCSVGADPCWEL